MRCGVETSGYGSPAEVVTIPPQAVETARRVLGVAVVNHDNDPRHDSHRSLTALARASATHMNAVQAPVPARVLMLLALTSGVTSARTVSGLGCVEAPSDSGGGADVWTGAGVRRPKSPTAFGAPTIGRSPIALTSHARSADEFKSFPISCSRPPSWLELYCCGSCAAWVVKPSDSFPSRTQFFSMDRTYTAGGSNDNIPSLTTHCC